MRKYTRSSHRANRLTTGSKDIMTGLKKEVKQLQEFYALQGKRVCNACNDVLALCGDNFTKDKKGLGGFMSRCKRCTNAAAKQRAKSGYGFGYSLENGFTRAKAMGRKAWRVTEPQLVKHLRNQRNHDPENCYYTGVTLQTQDSSNRATYRHLEHIVPLSKKGSMHRVGNLVPCSAVFNTWKADQPAHIAVLKAPEHLQATTCYLGCVDGPAQADANGNPDVPGQLVTWEPNGCDQPPREMSLEEAKAILS